MDCRSFCFSRTMIVELNLSQNAFLPQRRQSFMQTSPGTRLPGGRTGTATDITCD